MPRLSESTRRDVGTARERYPSARSAILPALWAVQHELGYLSPDGMAEVAELLSIEPSEVEAVATFYSMYFKRPPGRHSVLVCVNVACALRGADEVVSQLEEKLGCPSGSTTADGAFTWESTIECLGGCGGAPMMQVDHHFHENLTPDRIDAILERYRALPGHSGDGGGHGIASAAPPEQQPHFPTGETPPPPGAQGPPSDATIRPPENGRGGAGPGGDATDQGTHG